MYPKLGVQCSVSSGEESEMSSDATSELANKVDEKSSLIKAETVGSVSVSVSCLNLAPSAIEGDENTSKREESINTSSIEVDKGKRTSAHSKNHSGKRKVKVDWTPGLHRKFVQAVEELGVDKAVPSKILELMGTDCLTRHNVASHLQKYRSHRKNVLAREAETASWNRRRQRYSTAGGTLKKYLNSCVPMTGFPPVIRMPHFRQLHVWGYPPTWAFPHPLPPLLHNGDASSYWYSYHHQDVPASGMPCCFLPRVFPAQPVPGLPSTSVYRVIDPSPSVGMPSVFTTPGLPKPPYDFDLSKESLDAAIRDVLSKPWLPLPLGLKPPSIDSVMSELQRQGISKIQPDLYLASHEQLLLEFAEKPSFGDITFAEKPSFPLHLASHYR